MPDPITATAVATSLLTLISQNESVKKLGNDFLGTITETIRPWFLIDDPVTEAAVSEITEVSEDKSLSPLAQKVLEPKLVQHLEANPAALNQLRELVRQGESKMASATLNQSTNIINNAGAQIGSQPIDTKVEGDMIIHPPKFSKE